MNCDKDDGAKHHDKLTQHLAKDPESFKRLAQKKYETIVQTLPDKQYETILSYGFNLVACGFALNGHDVHITNCCMDCGSCIGLSNLIYEDDLADLVSQGKKFDLVLAVDQALTYADTNEDQRELIATFASITEKTLVTTVRDYRNQNHNDKFFDEPFYIKQGDNERIVINHRKWNRGDRQAWNNYTYIIDENHNLDVVGPKKRRTLYFKQLAKFLYDNGAKDYTVHKEPLYKSGFSKAFQYIITAEF